MSQPTYVFSRLSQKASAWRFMPMLAVMATIFLLSHHPGDAISLPDISGFDKIAHALIYGILAAASLYALIPYKIATYRWLSSACVIFFCLFYGLSDEFHQSFIPGRDASLGDVSADFLGATLTVLLYSWQHKKTR